MRKPNIIYIMADQLRYQSCGYNGDEKAHTPNIDRFSRESLSFDNAVTGMPVCSAYRASLFTGKYTTSTGMVINEIRLNPDHHKPLAACLTEGGYETAYMGKWHLWARELGNHFYPENSFTPRGKYRLGFDGHWEAYNFHHQYYKGYYHTESRWKQPYEGYEPDVQTDRAIDYLKSIAREKPFSLFLSYGTPHDPWTEENVPNEWFEMFRKTEFPVPPNYSDEMDSHGDAWSNVAKSPEQLQRWMRVYYAMTANLDWNLGRLMEGIRDAGLEEDTIVIFTSDHGEMFGAQGRMKKNIFYDEAERVPFLMRWPGHVAPGEKNDICLNAPDIMPTLLGLCGLEIPEEVEGMDVSRCALDGEGPEPEAAFLMNTGACAAWENGHEWRGLRDKRFTYAVFKSDGEEHLYDNLSDPYQMTNLASASAEKQTDDVSVILKKYRNQLKKKMESVNDTFADSLWYRDNWVEDRCIMRTATRP